MRRSPGLRHNGLVELLPNRGAIVRQLGADELRHIYQLREALEGLTAELACERCTPDDLQRGLRTLFDAAAAVHDANFAAACRQVDQELHRLIAVRSGNPVLAQEYAASTIWCNSCANEWTTSPRRSTKRWPSIGQFSRHSNAGMPPKPARHDGPHSSCPRSGAATRFGNFAAGSKAEKVRPERFERDHAVVDHRRGVVRGDDLQAAAPVDFVREIRPILSAKCVACHGARTSGRTAVG